ncbi:hypothetical protein EB796_002549 [Bugula neritina]|uniref:Uncharacterized protein n=1 Tax=Bugula neritina TaxID=10212 RepID=A0A7J7KLW8_BUGNE|nr:hypothetical protein EB796_002549 [Bugula neritina]
MYSLVLHYNCRVANIGWSYRPRSYRYRVVFNLDDGEHLLSLLHELTSLGAVFRTMISQAVVDTERYSREFIFNNSHGRVMSTITTDFECRWVIHLVQI